MQQIFLLWVWKELRRLGVCFARFFHHVRVLEGWLITKNASRILIFFLARYTHREDFGAEYILRISSARVPTHHCLISFQHEALFSFRMNKK